MSTVVQAAEHPLITQLITELTEDVNALEARIQELAKEIKDVREWADESPTEKLKYKEFTKERTYLKQERTLLNILLIELSLDGNARRVEVDFACKPSLDSPLSVTADKILDQIASIDERIQTLSQKIEKTREWVSESSREKRKYKELSSEKQELKSQRTLLKVLRVQAMLPKDALQLKVSIAPKGIGIEIIPSQSPKSDGH
jgi:predicted  nucleic acid-binding Zn-ribbon protein